jgi:hypothetical protein
MSGNASITVTEKEGLFFWAILNNMTNKPEVNKIPISISSLEVELIICPMYSG